MAVLDAIVCFVLWLLIIFFGLFSANHVPRKKVFDEDTRFVLIGVDDVQYRLTGSESDSNASRFSRPFPGLGFAQDRILWHHRSLSKVPNDRPTRTMHHFPQAFSSANSH